MTLPHQDNELRKKLELAVRGNVDLAISIDFTLPQHEEQVSDTIDAILDIIISELPKEKDAYRDGSNLTYEIFGYNSAISEITAILTAAKEAK